MTPDEHILKQFTKSFRSETPLEGYLLIGNEKPRLANGIPYLGNAKNAEAVIEKYGITDIYLSLSFPAYKKIHSILTRLVDNSYNVWVLKACISQHTERHSISASINESLTPLTPPQRISKRIFDILLGVALQLLALPLMSIIALAIKLDSPGPIIFKQLRVGQHGRLFQIYKFRTMISGAEEQLGEDLPYDQDGNINHKIPDDPRVTRVGRFLRKTSLDELPQFINVLIGDMSLVGPRPELPIIVAGYQPWQYERFGGR